MLCSASSKLLTSRSTLAARTSLRLFVVPLGGGPGVVEGLGPTSSAVGIPDPTTTARSFSAGAPSVLSLETDPRPVSSESESRSPPVVYPATRPSNFESSVDVMVPLAAGDRGVKSGRLRSPSLSLPIILSRFGAPGSSAPGRNVDSVRVKFRSPVRTPPICTRTKKAAATPRA